MPSDDALDPLAAAQADSAPARTHWAAVAALSVGVFAHEGSTVVVCLNGLRLLFGGNK